MPAPTPAEDPPALEDWRDLLHAALLFHDAAPWTGLGDTPVIGVRDPETGEVGYASVLGANGQVFGLLVFRGPEGLWAHGRANASADSPQDGLAALSIAPVLQCTFGPRDGVLREEREVFKTLGLHLRGATAWPTFRSTRPGYMPWRLTRAEARHLSTVLAATTAFSRTPAWRPLLDEAAASSANLRRVVVVTRDPAGAWRAGLDEVEPRPVLPIDAGFDRVRARRLAARTGPRAGVWQLDLRSAPFGIGAAGARLEASWLGLAVDDGSGLIVHMDVYPARERLQPSRFVLDAMQEARLIPAELRLCRRDVARALAELGEALGCTMRWKARLPHLEAAWNALLASRA
jgi:hypothetical protein